MRGPFRLTAGIRLVRPWTRLVGAWRSNARGIAAVEFALVLPVMVGLLLGLTEVTAGVSTDRKLTVLTRSLADLTAQDTIVSTTEMGNIFAAAATMMQPYDSTKVKMVVSSILVTQITPTTFKGTVAWSCAKGTGAIARTLLTDYPVPSGFANSNTASFILAETTMPYKPAFGYSFTGTMTLAETTPWPVRNSTTVVGPITCP